MKRTLALVISVLFFGVLSVANARAGMVDVSYTQKAVSVDRHLTRIAQMFRLSDQQESEARSEVMRFMFFGPCRGSFASQDSKEYPGLPFPFYSPPPPSLEEQWLDYFAAKNVMISYLLTGAVVQGSNLGRTPYQDICRFVAESAFERIEIKTVLKYCFTPQPPADKAAIECSTIGNQE